MPCEPGFRWCIFNRPICCFVPSRRAQRHSKLITSLVAHFLVFPPCKTRKWATTIKIAAINTWIKNSLGNRKTVIYAFVDSRQPKHLRSGAYGDTAALRQPRSLKLRSGELFLEDLFSPGFLQRIHLEFWFLVNRAYPCITYDNQTYLFWT